MRILAVEDGGFSPGLLGGRRGKALLVGAIFSDLVLAGVLITKIAVDGMDATRRLIEMVERSGERFDLILLSSISYGGFNLMDPIEIQNHLSTPVLTVNPKRPRRGAVERALRRHFPDWKERVVLIAKVGSPSKVEVGDGTTLYFYPQGLSESEAEGIIRGMVLRGKRPEPLRIARIIARGLS